MEQDQSHKVLMVAYDGVNLIDLSGPLQAFAEASRMLVPIGGARYELSVASIEGGPVVTSPGLPIITQKLGEFAPGSVDTLIVPGAAEGGKPPCEPDISKWIRANAAHVGRACSVCTGAFILADAQLLDGKRATTHWRWAPLLRERYPSIAVTDDAIYVEDDGIWSSGGVTAGIDLALALIEADHGHQTAIGVARELVVYLKRSGGQSQYSAPLAAQQAGGEAFSQLHAWIHDNLAGDLRVERLAEIAGMSLRTFSRSYVRAIGWTPAKTVERMRMEAACLALTDTDRALKDIARNVGLSNEQNLRRLFQRYYGINPVQYRHRFSGHLSRSPLRSYRKPKWRGLEDTPV